MLDFLVEREVLMAYRPEVDEIVLIERSQDRDCFKAKIIVVSDDGKMILPLPLNTKTCYND